MKLPTLSQTTKMVLSMVAVCTIASSLHAAPILTADLNNDESQIVNTGKALISAGNFGSQAIVTGDGNTQTVDINGIVHQVASVAQGGDGAELITNATINSSFDGHFRDNRSTLAGYTGDLQNLIAGIAGIGSPGPLTLDMAGLTLGATYLFQGYWEANNHNQVITATFEGTDTLAGITGAGKAVLISYEFVASDDTLNLSLLKTAGTDSLWLQGYSLQTVSEVPEPGSLALFGLAGVFMLRRRAQS